MLARFNRLLGVFTIVGLILAMAPGAALANPPYPGDPIAPVVRPGPDKTLPARIVTPKGIDQPNLKDYLLNRQRQALLESGQTTQAKAMALSGTDRVLVIMVEYGGPDVFTWTAGTSQWDPLNIANPNEAVYDAGGNVIVGNCSNIITQTSTFTYTGPLHNQIPRPLSAADRSGDSIWTEDFNPTWFNDFMFGNGVTFNYTRTDLSLVNEDFTGKSVANFYREFSNSAYNIVGDVVGWVQLPHSSMWYGADQCPGARSGGGAWSGSIPGAGTSKSLVKDALDAVNVISTTIPGFDWANYDLDGDGVIDRLWIVHSGYGEEDSPTLTNRTPYGEAAMWSHSGAVTPVYSVTQEIAAGPYIMMPENGGIGVFAHEMAHNLGADDLYAYGNGDTSAGFWTTMADDWTGYPIGFQPPAFDPWHLDNWGWLNPALITDTNRVYTVTLRQASMPSAPAGAQLMQLGDRGAKIVLPDGAVPLAAPPWQGTHYWWGGKQDVANARMTMVNPVAATANTTLSFDLVYDIEDQWDYMWVQVSANGGSTWDTITNTNTTCTHVADWIGGLYGFPDDMCAVGLGGFTNYNASWPSPEVETFNLAKYAGQNILVRLWYMTDWGTTYTGVFVDNFKIMDGATTLFSDDAESGSANWTYAAPWVLSDGTKPFSHNVYLQWRNTSESGGYDSALGDSRWRYGPANTGMLVWYNNNAYSDNEVFNYLTDYPGFGPKGRMLVVDANPDPYRNPYMVSLGYNNEAGNVAHRGLMRDAPFSLADSVPFTMKDTYAITSSVLTASYAGRPAVSAFHDAWGYYPGAENVPGGPVGQTTPRWMTKEWDASAVVPSTEFYGIKAPGYTGGTRFRFGCSLNSIGQNLCYAYGSGIGFDGGSGNPGDVMGQYGWHAQILDQTLFTATVRVWNSMLEANQAFLDNKTSSFLGDSVTFSYVLTQNKGSLLNLLACVPLDTAKEEFVAGSATNGAVLVDGVTCGEAAQMVASKQSLPTASTKPSSTSQSVVWMGQVPTTLGSTFSFSVKPKILNGQITNSAILFNGLQYWTTLQAPTVTMTAPPYRSFLPLVMVTGPANR